MAPPSFSAHAWAKSQVLAHVESSEAGLSNAEAARRLSEIGPNELKEKRAPSALFVFARQFRSPLIYLLILAAALAFVMGARMDAFVIIGVVIVNSAIGAFQERRAERSMAALRRITSIKARTLRSDQEVLIDARELVPGDVIVLAAGDAVAADARLLDAAALTVAEAVLTGESLPVTKSCDALPESTSLADRRNMLFAGTYLAAGRARAVVVATGSAAEVGQIAKLTQGAKAERTPLEQRIDKFGRFLLGAGAGVFVAVLVAGLLRGLELSEIVMVAISQLVSVVPEGLPAAMTVALAVGMQRMAGRGAIVRRLSAVESLGSTTIICTDKTGTLTRNEMTVTTLYLASGRKIAVTGVGYAPKGALREGGKDLTVADDAPVRELCEAVALCNDAELQLDESAPRALGDPTEVALLVLTEKSGVSVADLRARIPRTAELPFDAKAKMMATQHEGRVIVKGAPEAVLSLCSKVRTTEQSDSVLDADGRQRALEMAEAMASRALRALAVAVVEPAPVDLVASDFEGLQGQATFLGLIGQIDPPRDGISEVISKCRSAGIRTVMVTGDHKATGLAIASEIGIAREGDLSLDEQELVALDDRQLADKLARVAVFARVPPAQKLRVVDAFKARGEVVAMTGDGVNDAPALARADVGVAMGITGTDVAKQASDIVITDDNFATIVSAIEEGRVVYRNLKKVVLLLLSTGLAEILVLILAVGLGYPLPFAAVQILWNNVITEGTITINLTLDPPEGDEMQRPPIPKGEPIVTRAMVGRLVLMGMTIAAATLGFFILRMSMGMPLAEARTATFTLLAVCEWFNVLNCRSVTHSALTWDVLRNRWLLGGIILSNLLQIAVVYLPALNKTFHTVPLPWSEVLIIGAVGSLVLWVEEARKWLARRRSATTEAHDQPMRKLRSA